MYKIKQSSQIFEKEDNVRDSLRFSYDPQLTKYNDLDISKDGLQLTFNFQDQNTEKIQNNNINNNVKSKHKRKQIFQKFKKKACEEKKQTDNQILKTFDTIFNSQQSINQERPSLKKLRKITSKSKQEQNKLDVSLTLQSSKLQIIQTQNSISEKNQDSISFQDFVKQLNQQQNTQISKNLKIIKSVQNVEDYVQDKVKSQTNYLDNPVFQEENRIPPFLRKVRKVNAIYPNFDNPAFKKQNQRGKIRQMCKLFQNALNQLHSFTKKVQQKSKGGLQFSKNFSEAFTLGYFLNSKWQKSKDIINLDRIRPLVNYSARSVSFQNIYKAFTNYRTIIQYYRNYAQLDLPKQRNKYFEIRNKFWSVQKNLNSISQDIYSVAMNFQFPYHYYEFLYVLRTQVPMIKKQQQSVYKVMLKNLIHLQNIGQFLSCSEVGKAVREKLQRSILR